MLFHELRGHGLVLFPFKRAGRVQEYPTRPNHFSGVSENASLLRRKLGNIRRLNSPAYLRVAPERASPRTRRIHKHAIERRVNERQITGSVNNNPLSGVMAVGNGKLADNGQ